MLLLLRPVLLCHCFTMAAFVVVVVGVVVIVVASTPSPASTTRPLAHPNRQHPAHRVDDAPPPPPSPPRGANSLPLRHPMSGNTCCSSSRGLCLP